MEPDPVKTGVGNGDHTRSQRLSLLSFRKPFVFGTRRMFKSDDQKPVATALTIAGSDSGGGAGIQADLKSFSAHGVYGASIITAVTAQNTRLVAKVEAISPAMIRSHPIYPLMALDMLSFAVGLANVHGQRQKNSPDSGLDPFH